MIFFNKFVKHQPSTFLSVSSKDPEILFFGMLLFHWDTSWHDTHTHPPTHTQGWVPWGSGRHNVIIIHRIVHGHCPFSTADVPFVLCNSSHCCPFPPLESPLNSVLPPKHQPTHPANPLQHICNPFPQPRTPTSALPRSAPLQNKPAVLAGRVPLGRKQVSRGPRGLSIYDTWQHALQSSSNLLTHHWPQRDWVLQLETRLFVWMRVWWRIQTIRGTEAVEWKQMYSMLHIECSKC